MLPKYHLLINLIISIFLFYFAIINLAYVIIFFLASVLIDVDHYIYYILEKRKFSLNKAYKWFILKKSYLHKLSKQERKKHHNIFFLFHGIEILILLFIISKTYYFVFFVFLGFVVHLAEDAFDEAGSGVFVRKLFLVYGLYKHFNLKNIKNFKNAD